MSDPASIAVYQLNRHPDERPGFALKRMETLYDQSGGGPDRPHRHSYYTAIWVEAATGTHQVDFTTYDLAPQQLYFIAPGQVHQLVAADRPAGWVLTFTPAFLAHHQIGEHFMLNLHRACEYGQSPPLHVAPPQDERLATVVREMAHLMAHPRAYHDEALGALLKLFLIHAHSLAPDVEEEAALRPAEPSARACILRDFRSLIETRFRQTHTIADYADAMHISAKHLNQVVKTLMGKTAKELVQDRIVLEAQRLLRFTGLSIKEIAYELGFGHPLHFSAFFRNCTGQSPTAYRQNHLPASS